MDDMLEELRPASLEEALKLFPRYVEPAFLPGERVTSGLFNKRWTRAVMADTKIEQMVHNFERQLFARLLRDMYLVHIDNYIPNDLVDEFRMKLNHEYKIDAEVLFRETFGEYFKLKDLPDRIELGYNGFSLYVK
jgi:hypothetical protein